jgi:hypothetical protein
MSYNPAQSRLSPRHAQRARARSLIADLAVATLAFLVLLCVGLLVPPLWTALIDNPALRPHACDPMKLPPERLACEVTREDDHRPPAKGAFAPLNANDAARTNGR